MPTFERSGVRHSIGRQPWTTAFQAVDRGSNPGCCPSALGPHGRTNPSRRGPSRRIISSSSIASIRSRTSSPAFSRSRAISRTVGIVFWVSQSRVSFLRFVGAAREGSFRVMIPSCLTNVCPTSRPGYLVAPPKGSGGITLDRVEKGFVEWGFLRNIDKRYLVVPYAKKRIEGIWGEWNMANIERSVGERLRKRWIPLAVGVLVAMIVIVAILVGSFRNIPAGEQRVIP